ncbi:MULTISPECIES: hypothetical protein [unclassified Nostoc]|uniref:hypothetical protein n=1 Tax=unclassified Nostoc TaxID=2593658 RepID=UPI002AD3C7FE|nr:hypothetical protein [Nostoc sp. DedQUE03]MDZ7974626.1 hypothetical protein [Nostoc sp. DedQUE03]MDZ8046969.1 hypothetical protein [Nostoc sp. DedQUE02]
MTEFDRGMAGTAKKTIWNFAKIKPVACKEKLELCQVPSLIQTSVQGESSADSSLPKSQRPSKRFSDLANKSQANFG